MIYAGFAGSGSEREDSEECRNAYTEPHIQLGIQTFSYKYDISSIALSPRDQFLAICGHGGKYTITDIYLRDPPFGEYMVPAIEPSCFQGPRTRSPVKMDDTQTAF